MFLPTFNWLLILISFLISFHFFLTIVVNILGWTIILILKQKRRQPMLWLILHQFLMSQSLNVISLLALKLNLLASHYLHFVFTDHFSGYMYFLLLGLLDIRCQHYFVLAVSLNWSHLWIFPAIPCFIFNAAIWTILHSTKVTRTLYFLGFLFKFVCSTVAHPFLSSFDVLQNIGTSTTITMRISTIWRRLTLCQTVFALYFERVFFAERQIFIFWIGGRIFAYFASASLIRF